MTNILKQYPSKSSAKTYSIIEPMGGGDPYCDCPGWKFSKDSPRSCKHLKNYHATLGEVDEPIDQEVPSVDIVDGEDMGDEIEQAIQKVMKSVE